MSTEPAALQLIYEPRPPFGHLALWFSQLLRPLRVRTVFITGTPEQAPGSVAALQPLYLQASRRELRGSRRALTKRLRQRLAAEDAAHPALFVGHRVKALHLACELARGQASEVLGVLHQFGTLDRWSRRLLLWRWRRGLTLGAVSEALGDELRNRMGTSVPVQVCSNGLMLDDFTAALETRPSARQRLGLDDSFWFVNPARLAAVKDQHTLLRAFERVVRARPQARLLLAGEGPERAALETLADQLGIAGKLRFAGQISGLPTLLRAFDGCVLSSRRESFGLALLEAMAAEVPVIGTRTGGVPEVLGDAGTLTPCGDAGAMASAMIDCVDLPAAARAAQIAAGSERVASHFDLPVLQRTFWASPLGARLRDRHHINPDAP